jgi:DNA polymerase I-like protein with 3'-5' exonuclease and polymerase domains
MVGGAYSALKYIENNNLPWKIQNLVHDSAIFQIPQDQIVSAINVMQDLFVTQAVKKMESLGVKFNLPLGIDVEVGINWGSLEKWNGTQSGSLELENKVKDYWKNQ